MQPNPRPASYDSTTPNPWVQNKNMDPIIVVLLNLLCLGLGHILMGQERKGGSIIIVAMVAPMLIMIPVVLIAIAIAGPFGMFAIWAVAPLIWVWAVMVHIDGYKIAKRIKEGYPVQHGESINGFVSIGTGLLLGGRPRFHHSSEDKPREWVEAVNAFETERAKWQAAGYAYPPQPGYAPPTYGPPPGQYPQGGYAPQAGYAPQPGYAPQGYGSEASPYTQPMAGSQPPTQWAQPGQPAPSEQDAKAWGYDGQQPPQ